MRLGKKRLKSRETRHVAVAIFGALLALTASAGEPRVAVMPGNQFVVMEADSVAASRLDSQYSGRLRRVSKPVNAMHLNNVGVVISSIATRVPNAPDRVLQGAPAPTDAQPTACGQDGALQSPNEKFILVCVDQSDAVSERDQRALQAFIAYAQRESLSLAAHVSGEREWSALERALFIQGDEKSRRRIPFREVRYGDGLSAGQIRIDRLGAN